MKCLKVEEYIKRTSSVKEAELLKAELQDFLNGQPGLQGRTLCDRVIRACNHQLGVDPSDRAHVCTLVQLVKVAVEGYDKVGKDVAERTPFYMEKIIFHILKKLSSLDFNNVCSDVAELLHSRLLEAEKCEDLSVLVRSSFSVLWNRTSASKDKTTLIRDKLHSQFQALSFLLLLDADSDGSLPLKTPTYALDAICQFENSLGTFTNEDSVFLSEEIHRFFSKFWTADSVDQLQRRKSFLNPVFQIVVMVVKVLSKAGHYDAATNLLDKSEIKVQVFPGCQRTAHTLARLAVKIHSASKASKGFGQFLTEGARALRSFSVVDRGAGAVLESCGLVVWAVESSSTKALSGSLLLACFSFLEEHQECITKVIKMDSICQSERERLQRVLCISIYQGFVFAYESMQASQLEDPAILDRVLLFCQACAGQIMSELHKMDNENFGHKQDNENLCIKAVVAISNLACGLYNRHLYEQAFALLELLCKDLCKRSPSSLSADRLSRPFMLVVQSSRRAGRLERALDWVILWLKALGDRITGHMTEPVSLWVKTKMDAAKNADEDIRLRTLRDGFGPDVPEQKILLSLLEEELRVYKETPGDTAQERYNTLCDLLDICHEESPHPHLRAVYLCEMAQVVCFQDFSEQTDCSAVDFTHEALRLLEAEQRTPENTDRLTDDKARALLWLYICSLEKTIQESIDKDKKQQGLKEQTPSTTAFTWTNDFEYDKLKSQAYTVYDDLHFSLDAHNQQCQPLDRALSEWSALLKRGTTPSVRNPKQTCSSIALMAALFRLMGKPLKALEAYQLAIGLAQKLEETQSCATFLCQSASLLLDIGSPEMALSQIEKAEKCLSSQSPSEGPSPLSLQVVLLKAQHCYITGQVSRGVLYLCEVLKEANEQKQSKSWYLLRARTLHTVGTYLCLDTLALPHSQRKLIHQYGFSSADTAVYEGLKLLCSLLITLVGKGLYGSHGGSPDVRFVDQGDNLSVKWLLLCELLSCSVKLVSVRSHSGAVNDARLQCLEALQLATRLQALSQCAELLVLKAELELMQGEKDDTDLDLDKVRHLLELCTDVSDQKPKSERKIKPRKGRPAQKPDSPLSPADDDLGDLLSTRWIHIEPVLPDVTCSSPVKPRPRRWLSSLSHKPDCPCCVCSEPCLARVTMRWAAARADLDLQLDPDQAKTALKLRWAALTRSKNISAKLGVKLGKILTVKTASKPFFVQDVVARIYHSIALTGLDPRMSKVCNVWKVLEAGLAFANSTPNPVVLPFKAGLMTTKALLSLMTIACNKGCLPEELFSHIWDWKLPKDIKTKLQMAPRTPQVKLEAAPKSKDSGKVGNSEKIKEMKKPKTVKPRLGSASSSSWGRGLVPTTPGMVTPRMVTPVMPNAAQGELSVFDFNTAIPTLAFTPVHKVRPPASAQKAPKTASKFQVFEELSPEPEKPTAVPAAPKRTRRLRFKVDFSDESDAEADPQPTKEESKTRSTKKSTHSRKASQDPSTPAPEKTPVAKRTGRKKNTAIINTPSTEEEEPVRRGRTKRTTRATKADCEEGDEPDKMRTIEEEVVEVLDMSIEELRASDTENEEGSSQNLDTHFEVLRRDMGIGLGKEDLCELKSRGQPAEGAATHLPNDNYKPDNLSLDDVKSLLSSAWLMQQDFPSPNIYSSVCSLLALAFGQEDPVTTAMLHTQSLGITSRHRTVRHLASSLRKLKKNSVDLKDKMEALTLSENSSDELSAAQRFAQLEEVFSFPIADASDFPKRHCQEFKQQLQHIPPGVCVCVLSSAGLKPGQMGDALLVSRLERDAAPVSVLVPTCRQKRSLSWIVQEMDNIRVEMKVVSSVADKAKWWDGRRALDTRLEELLEEMEDMLTCWKSLLLPLSSDPELCSQVQQLHKSLSGRGVCVSQHMLKTVLSAAPVLSDEDLRTFGFGLSPQWDVNCEQLLQAAVSQLSDREEPRGHVVLILDKHLQRLPWESLSLLKSRSVSRMPSLHSLIALSMDKEIIPDSILKQGVDVKKVFYVLDPDGNLEYTKEQFRECFSSKTGWEGVCGVAPDPVKLVEAISSKDLYIYNGHGSGARFLDSKTILKTQMRAASLLFGCSSAALGVRGEQEGEGIILYYLIAGCPFVLGNLWDVTDRDIDRFTTDLLESWLSAGPGASLLDHMGAGRQGTRLKHLTGAAPVVYGLPIHLL